MMDWLFCMCCPRPIEETVIEIWQIKNRGYPKLCANCFFEGLAELINEVVSEPLPEPHKETE